MRTRDGGEGAGRGLEGAAFAGEVMHREEVVFQVRKAAVDGVILGQRQYHRELFRERGLRGPRTQTRGKAAKRAKQTTNKQTGKP